MSSLSDFLGYASIASWLGAQFPQVLENVRRQSCDGLALPFLLNWLMGDATNLLGCILTRQLPFQTWLATYFCCVDCALLCQYLYYSRKAKAMPPYLQGRSRTASTATRRMSMERGPTHYRALSTVAANVAAAAAIAAQQEEHSHWQRHSYEGLPRSAIEPYAAEQTDDDEVDDDALARLADSFHSEGGRSARRKKVSWSQERGPPSATGSRQSTMSPTGRMHASLHMTAQPSQAGEPDPLAARGRSLLREADSPVEEGDAEWSAANQRRSSRASRKSATMVFMGVWALWGLGTLAGNQQGVVASSRSRFGRVLSRAEVAISGLREPVPAAYSDYRNSLPTPIPAIVDLPQRIGGYTATSAEEPPSTEYIIGRISAWTCTTLYLTSRLPQIWKNFARKSVEGLSMYLFIFAFLGNFFYVASILTSPRLARPAAEASAFIRESIPYLLGSGGTLVFDVTIVTQSFLYRPKVLTRGRRNSCTASEEEAGLLSAGATGADDPSTPSRRRAGGSTDPDSLGY